MQSVFVPVDKLSQYQKTHDTFYHPLTLSITGVDFHFIVSDLD